MKPLEQIAMPDTTDKDMVVGLVHAQWKKILLLSGITYPDVTEILKNLSK